MTERVARVGGRVLLLDPDGRVLLIHELIEDGSSHWLTPGGGLEGDESPAEAAVRETVEEVGLQVELERPDAVLVTQREWSWRGTVYDQTDHFFLARTTHNPRIAPRALTPMEQHNVLGHGWWTVQQLRASDEVLVPSDLADVVERLREPGADR